MKHLFIFLLVISHSGCMSSGVPFIPEERTNPNNSLVYIYRPYVWDEELSAPKVYIGDRECGYLSTGNYLVEQMEPGRYTILVGKKENDNHYVAWVDNAVREVDLEAGKDYYFRVELSGGSIGFLPIPGAPMVVWTGHDTGVLQRVEPDEAIVEIQKTKYRAQRNESLTWDQGSD